jgi:hypothetical protein
MEAQRRKFEQVNVAAREFVFEQRRTAHFLGWDRLGRFDFSCGQTEHL